MTTRRAAIPLDIRRTLILALEQYGGDDGRAALEFVRTMPVESLTAREIEVMRLVALGLTNQEVADVLTNARTGDDSLSERTVRSHMSVILSKLHLRNRVELTLYALRHGFAVLDEMDEEDDAPIGRKDTDDENLLAMFASGVDVRTNGLRHTD